MSDYRILLSFYQDQSAAGQILHTLRKNGFPNSAVIRKNVHGRISVSKTARFSLRNRINQSLINRYTRWMLAGETVVLVRTSQENMRSALAILRRVGSGQATIFGAFNDQSDYNVESTPCHRHRREHLSGERMRALTENLAADLKDAVIKKDYRSEIMRDLKKYRQIIDMVRRDLTSAAGLEQNMMAGAEWLLDNIYLVEGQISEITQNLPRKMYKKLPAISTLKREGPRILILCRALLEHNNAALQRDLIISFLKTFQEKVPLTSTELWAFPTFLRFALVEQLMNLSLTIRRRQEQYLQAEFWANRLLNASRRNADQLLFLLAEMAYEIPEPSGFFAVTLASYLQNEANTMVPVQEWLERKLDAPLGEITRREQEHQTSDQSMMAHLIGSFRMLAHLEWPRVFESVSPVEQLLQTDPAGVYGAMDFCTRDLYRHAVEELSEGSNLNEIEVVSLAIDLASEYHKPVSAASATSQSHVGYYLIGRGRRTLESKIHYRPSFHRLIRNTLQKRPGRIYLGTILAITTAATAAAALLFRLELDKPATWLPLLTLFLAATELGVQLTNRWVSRVIPPTLLPRLSFENGIPDEFRTLVIVPTMLLSKKAITDEIKRLEMRYLANSDANLLYCLVTDFCDAPTRTTDLDAELLDMTVRQIKELNERYEANRFFLFHRTREWSEGEQCWMGWERKRGKIEQLNIFLVENSKRKPHLHNAHNASTGNGRATAPENSEPAPGHEYLLVGNAEDLRGIKFVLTLDSDTQLPRDTARKLVEAAAHPLNRPEFDRTESKVIGGYTIIQPRVSTSLPSSYSSVFTRIFSDPAGVDPYCQAVSDAYQDLFGSGTFYGKGIYDLEAFHKVLSERFPEETILSHDLLEGAHVRVGLASDIELFDLFPTTYQSYVKRQHRWIRGDWQIIDWLFRYVPGPGHKRVPNCLNLIERWKIFDNLRRSLLPATLLTMLVLGWLLTDQIFLWSFFVAFILGLPLLFHVLSEKDPYSSRRTSQAILLKAIMQIAFLPHQALVSLDAIFRVWHRRVLSHRHLLEWETAQAAQLNRPSNKKEQQFLMQVLLGSVLATALFLVLAVRELSPATAAASATASFWWAAPILLLWFFAPLLAFWLNTPAQPTERTGAQAVVAQLPPDDTQTLRIYARKTWRYFDDFVNSEMNWLPPDNYQEQLRIEAAPRTSPTNIGLWLLSALSAYDLGYLTLEQFVERATATLETVGKLEHYAGHLLNWYDIKSMEPLHPRYVSVVDSGNFLACLWTLEQGCQELLHRPLIDNAVLKGLQDLINILSRVLDAKADPSTAELLAEIEQALDHALAVKNWRVTVQTLRQCQKPAATIYHIFKDQSPSDSEPAYWAAALQHSLADWNRFIDRYFDDLAKVTDEAEKTRAKAEAKAQTKAQATNEDEIAPSSPTLHDLIMNNAPAGADAPQPSASQAHARDLLDRLKRLIKLAQTQASGMSMRFLYDAERRLFSIGYNVQECRLDDSYYDFLASEARLASYVAIARGDVPNEHWFALGRPFSILDGRTTLLSWNGTMFEYLMPLLLNRVFQGSLLEAAYKASVARHITYGKIRGIPWGISEAAFSALDNNKIYQYQAFGVPGLGLKRGLEQDLVVAPYASMLALLVAPKKAVANLKTLEGIGMLGRFGFYDSIDYTRQRRPEGERGVIVYATMAHHQGMSLVAMNNFLNNSIMQKRFHRNLRVKAAEPLLYERIPTKPQMSRIPAGYEATPKLAPLIQSPVSGRFLTPHTAIPRTQLLSNGTLHVMITNAGGSYCRYLDTDITRWRSDTTRDNWGEFLYIRDCDSDAQWSAAYHPSRHAGKRYSVSFAPDRAEFRRRDAGFETTMEVIVSPEENAEIRCVTLTNRSAHTRTLELTSYMELALAKHSEDLAHPSFSKLFVETAFLKEYQALIARRKPKSRDEKTIWAGHMIAEILSPSENACASAPASAPVSASASASAPASAPATSAPAPAPSALPYASAPAPATEPERLISYETSRESFLGRDRSVRNPRAMEGNLTNSSGYVLDPIFSLRTRVTIKPGERARFVLITAAAQSREELIAIFEKFKNPNTAAATDSAFEMAWTQSQLELRHLRLQPDAVRRFQELANHILYPNPRLRPTGGRLRLSSLNKTRLWAYGISGDLPIIALTVTDVKELDFVHEILTAHAYLRTKGLKADLVILNYESSGYYQPLQESLRRMAQAHSMLTGLDQPGGVFLRTISHMPDDDVLLILASARVLLVAARGTLAQQLGSQSENTHWPPRLKGQKRYEEYPRAEFPAPDLEFFNGYGGFSKDGKEYVIQLPANVKTPSPWINVLSNAHFGALVTESGMGTVWFGNSQLNRLLPWSNDPISNPPSDAIYIRDEDTGAFWTATPSPVSTGASYRVRHGQGYTVYESSNYGLLQNLTVFVPLDNDVGDTAFTHNTLAHNNGDIAYNNGRNGNGDPVRIQRLRLVNSTSKGRRISVTSYSELVLGNNREETQSNIITKWDPESNAMLARNCLHPDYGGYVAFAAMSPTASSFTADRTEFIGRNGSMSRPAAMHRESLSGRSGMGHDPCIALQTVIILEPHETAEIIIILGQGCNIEHVRSLVSKYKEPLQVEASLAQTCAWWDSFLDKVQVETPDLTVNMIINRWLLYQTLACRFWARTAFYQSGGAFGFRDQLQDVLAFLHAAPEITREFILTAASRQFVEGDVQHWWHPPSGAGTRTRSSDDLLWLPYAVIRYVKATGDYEILNVNVPFLNGRPLEPDEHDIYFVPNSSTMEQGTLFEHCRRAIEKGLTSGPHGLPLIGTGDWNDGFTRIGAKGRGESVWLAWFIIEILNGFSELCIKVGDDNLGRTYLRRAADLATQVEENAWDGKWYRRAYFDDGSPLGTHENNEAKIDSLPQSWAAICGAADPERTEVALTSAYEHLVRPEDQLSLLFTPPFEHTDHDPGYIKAYPPGVRENGGQYTHAAIWLAIAHARKGLTACAVELLQMINPIRYSDNPDKARKYRIEPYAVAGDVYSLPGSEGRGGWSWYTGSSGWMYRAWLEEILGIVRDGNAIRVEPRLPAYWPSCKVRYRFGKALYVIEISRDHRDTSGTGASDLTGASNRITAEVQIQVDGTWEEGNTFALVDDGQMHSVKVYLAED